MYNELVEKAYQRIGALLLSYPLAKPSAFTRLKGTPVPPPETEEYLLWALTFLELKPGTQTPFCTSAQSARNGDLERYTQSAQTLKQEMTRLIREISAALPQLQATLDNMAEHCNTYVNQAQLLAQRGDISLPDFRRIYKSYLSGIIQTCCSMLFEREHPLAGAALLDPIRTHLERIGVTTPAREGLQFDYDNYEPYFTCDTNDQRLDEHFESILLPAYLLGRSKVDKGLASCYIYNPKEENSDAVRTVTE